MAINWNDVEAVDYIAVKTCAVIPRLWAAIMVTSHLIQKLALMRYHGAFLKIRVVLRCKQICRNAVFHAGVALACCRRWDAISSTAYMQSATHYWSLQSIYIVTAVQILSQWDTSVLYSLSILAKCFLHRLDSDCGSYSSFLSYSSVYCITGDCYSLQYTFFFLVCAVDDMSIITSTSAVIASTIWTKDAKKPSDSSISVCFREACSKPASATQTLLLTQRAYVDYCNTLSVLCDIIQDAYPLTKSLSSLERMRRKYETYLRIACQNRDDQLHQLIELQSEIHDTSSLSAHHGVSHNSWSPSNDTDMLRQDLFQSVQWIERRMQVLDSIISNVDEKMCDLKND